MRLENEPVTCAWTAEQLNGKTISFAPNRSGMGNRMTGEIRALQVLNGLYIQISLKRPSSQQILYWLDQDEAERIQQTDAGSEIDFVLA